MAPPATARFAHPPQLSPGERRPALRLPRRDDGHRRAALLVFGITKAQSWGWGAMSTLGVLLGGRDPAFDCAAALDIDADGEVNLTDPVILLGWLFSRGASPAAPFPACGPAPDADLECRESSPACE